MKKWTKIAIFGAVTLCLCGTIFYFSKEARAAAPLISDIEVTNVTYNSATISWKTDIASQGKVSYGYSPNNYLWITPVTNSGTNHSVSVSVRPPSSPYTVYYKIIAYSGGEETATDKLTFNMSEPPTVEVKSELLNFNESAAYIKCYSDFSDIYNHVTENSIEYGQTSGNYDQISNYKMGDEVGIILENLWANTVYYYRCLTRDYSNNDVVFFSEEKTFTTLAEKPVITSINPTSGQYGTTITALGQGFGDQAGDFTIGTDYLSRLCLDQTEIISWSDTKIVAKLKNNYDNNNDAFGCNPKTGQVKAWSQGHWSDSGPAIIYMRIAEGPVFTITGTATTNVNTNTNTSLNTNASAGAVNITNKYGCNYSVSVSDKNTVKVNALFKEGSEADVYLGNVYNKYKEIWDRYPRCDELEFHLVHSTPLATLVTWLQDNIVKEAYGCKYSTTTSDDKTVKVTKTFGKDSDTDIYLARIYDEYSVRWGRAPRCDELQFHLDHNTPIDGLIAWLDQNKSASATPSAVAILNEATVAGVSIDLSKGESISFNANQEITFSGTAQPNSIVIITINSEPSVFTVMSDSEGKWSYTLEKNKLSAGTHTVTVALADKDLNKIEEGDPISFTVEAATAEKTAAEKTTDWISDYWYVWVLVAIAIIIIIDLIGRTIKKKSQ